jgi:hypothetical protein
MIRALLVGMLASGMVVACTHTSTVPTTAADRAACRGVVPSEGGPLASNQIEEVAPLYDLETVDKVQVYRFRGAAVTVAAEPGMTREALERAVRCDVGRDQGGARDPLAAATSVAVRPAEAGFTVEIRAETRQKAREILRRANELADVPPAPAAQAFTALR